jgi:hypothetical protein
VRTMSCRTPMLRANLSMRVTIRTSPRQWRTIISSAAVRASRPERRMRRGPARRSAQGPRARHLHAATDDSSGR